GPPVGEGGEQAVPGPQDLRQVAALDAAPEFPQSFEPAVRLVAGDETGVDGPDRRSDDPVRLDAGFVQRLIDAGLISPERAATLQHQNDLAAGGRGRMAARRLRPARGDRIWNGGHVRTSRPSSMFDVWRIRSRRSA